MVALDEKLLTHEEIFREWGTSSSEVSTQLESLRERMDTIEDLIDEGKM